MGANEPTRGIHYRAVLCGVGAGGPIEERLGRRIVGLVDPDSLEGRRLLRSGRVRFVGPEGDDLGVLTFEEAVGRLRRRLEERFADTSRPEDREALRDGLARLSAWSSAPPGDA